MKLHVQLAKSPTRDHIYKLCLYMLGSNSLYCDKWSTNSKSLCDLDLDRTMPNVEVVRVSFIHYLMLKFQVD